MGRPIRKLVWISALLAVGSFVYVLVSAPLPKHQPRRSFAQSPERSSQRPASINHLDQSFRSSMVQGRMAAAKNLSEQMILAHPHLPTSWYNRGLYLKRIGSDEEAWGAWQELERVAMDQPTGGIGQQARRAYFLGWASNGMRQAEESRAYFTEAAELYEQSRGSGAQNSQIAYNLACYWAMGGHPERAITHWERALEQGYADPLFWWVADPDLDPIREDPRFLDAARRYGYTD